MTSRPSRTGAIRLYDRLGLKLRDTNPYRYVFEQFFLWLSAASGQSITTSASC
jgi:hypothetical protein